MRQVSRAKARRLLEQLDAAAAAGAYCKNCLMRAEKRDGQWLHMETGKTECCAPTPEKPQQESEER